MGQLQGVYTSNNQASMSPKETLMNPIWITSLTAFALGTLAYLAHILTRKAHRQPILIERRKIIYRRRP
jgi:hypothetical protein